MGCDRAISVTKVKGYVCQIFLSLPMRITVITGKGGDEIVKENWFQVHQNFLKALGQIEEAVNRVQRLQEMELGRNTQRDIGKPAQAQSELLEQLPDVDLSAAGFPCHEFPASDENFLGRSEHLEQIEKALDAKKASTLCIVVISGFGGVGKSALALKAAHKCKEAKNYDAIFWLNAEDADVLRESYNKMACRLLLQGANEKSDKDANYMLVKNWLDKTSMYLLTKWPLHLRPLTKRQGKSGS